MNRRSFLQAATVLAAPLASVSPALAGAARGAASANATTVRSSESARRIEKATKAAMAMQRQDWEQGILAQAMLETDDHERVILLTEAAIVQKAPDGRLGVMGNGDPQDPAMGGAAYAKAAEWTRDPQILQAVDGLLAWIRIKSPLNRQGIFYHVFEGPEMWSDGFNCAPPFLAAMGYYDEALSQIEGYRKVLWNPEKKLLSHIWDDGKQKLTEPGFWGGGNGWAAAGLAQVIRSLPRERSQDRQRLAVFATELIDGCLAHQRPDGLFHNVVDQTDTFVETNLAQMLAYAIYTGISTAWLPASYRVHADRMRSGARSKMDAFGYVQGACAAPTFDHPGISTEAQAFCIMMEAAGSKLESAGSVHR